MLLLLLLAGQVSVAFPGKKRLYFLLRIQINMCEHGVAGNRLLRAGGLGGTREAYTIIKLFIAFKPKT